jgi:hypothetical protein
MQPHLQTLLQWSSQTRPNYSTKRGSAIFDQGCKALNSKALIDGFVMTIDQPVIFAKAFHRCTTAMGWNKGIKHTFSNSASRPVNIIKSFGQIDRGFARLDIAMPNLEPNKTTQ